METTENKEVARDSFGEPIEPHKPIQAQFISLWEFFSRCFCPFQNINIPLKSAHKKVCDALQDAYLGKATHKYIVVNIAPRVGKTKMMEALVCWAIAYFPDSHIINTSYSSSLAESSTRQVADIIDSEWYRLLFPWVVKGSLKRFNEFNTINGGHVYGTGVSGTIVGFGAGLKRRAGGCIIIDDPSNPSEVSSKLMNLEIQFWFENTILRRRNSSIYTPVIIVQQRLSVDDLSGYVLEHYPKETLHIKIETVVNEESIFPETISTEDCLTTKRINPFSYWAQLQQEPIVIGGNLIKIDNFVQYSDDSDAIKFNKKIITCDTALKTKEHNDYSVVQCWGKLNNKAYLIDQIRGKWESPELLSNFKAFYYKNHRAGSLVSRVTVEDKAAGTGLMQILKREGIPIQGVQRNVDKVSRVNDILPYIVTGMVYIPKGKTWLPDFLTECAQFTDTGKCKHDDQVDCMADGISFTLGKSLSIWDVIGGKKR